jgi:hypothetical protein
MGLVLGGPAPRGARLATLKCSSPPASGEDRKADLLGLSARWGGCQLIGARWDRVTTDLATESEGVRTRLAALAGRAAHAHEPDAPTGLHIPLAGPYTPTGHPATACQDFECEGDLVGRA